MPSKPKKKGAPGGSKKPKAKSRKVSSAASTNPLVNSPPSVSRSQQHQQSSGQIQNTPEQSQTIRHRQSPPIAPTPRTLAYSQSQQRSVQVEAVARANSTTRVQPEVSDEEEEEEEEAQDQHAFAGGEHEAGQGDDNSSEDEASSDEDDAANEGLYVTLNALLTAPGRADYLERLSPHIGEGTW